MSGIQWTMSRYENKQENTMYNEKDQSMGKKKPTNDINIKLDKDRISKQLQELLYLLSYV